MRIREEYKSKRRELSQLNVLTKANQLTSIIYSDTNKFPNVSSLTERYCDTKKFYSLI